MKRKQFINHIELHGCELIREGNRHSWWWNPKLNKVFYTQTCRINDNLARKICRDLGIPSIK